MSNLSSTVIDYSQLDAWKDELIAAWIALEEPFDFHMTQPRTTYLAAQRAGVNVVLDGVAGDVVLGHGSQMSRHIRSGQLTRAWRDAAGLTKFWGPGSASISYRLVQATRGAFVPDWLRAMRQTWRNRLPPRLPDDAIVDPQFAKTSGLIDSLNAARFTDRRHRMSFPEERLWSWPRSGITVGRERYDRVAAHFGVETRDPFMDQRLQAFCLSLPMDQFQVDGWPKMILRRAMAGLLPDEVRWRRGKEHLGATFTDALRAEWPAWKAPMLAERSNCIGRVRCEILEPARWSMEASGELAEPLDSLLQTSLFLNNHIR
jgi:asparagine synthase (glutamine-hydrolysing)